MDEAYFLRRGDYLRKVTISEGHPPGVLKEHTFGPIGVDWKLNTSFVSRIFGHHQTDGEVLFYYENAQGNYERGDTLGYIRPEYQLHLYKNGAYVLIFGHNRSTDASHPEYQEVNVWVADGVSIGQPIKLGRIGTEWDLQLIRIGSSQLALLGVQNKNGNIPGQLAVWYIESDLVTPRAITHHAIVGHIGTEWRLQSLDINGDGYPDIFGYNANNDLRVWFALRDDDGRLLAFDDARDYGGFGAGWQRLETSVLGAPPFSSFPSILGQSPSGAIHGWSISGERIWSDFDLSPRGLDPEWKFVPGWRQRFVV
jgi:hypothetical protein